MRGFPTILALQFQCTGKYDARRRETVSSHSGRRSRYSPLPAHPTAVKTGCATGWQVPARGYRYLKLHQLRYSAHVCSHAVQLGVAEPSYSANISLLTVFKWVR